MTDAKKDSVPQSPDGEGKRFLRDRCGRRSIPFKPRQNRQAMQSKVRPLKQWLIRHRDDPYPSKRDKEILARESDMALPQVSTWFANARRRLKKVVQGDDISWSARVELYNSHVDGNAELLSLSSDDSFNEMDDTEDEPISDVTASCKSSTSSATQQNSTSHSTSYMTSQSHMTHETPAHMDDVVVPSRSQTPISSPSFSDCFDNDLHSAFHRPVRHSMFDPGTQGKHKQIILQRYLNDLAHSPSSHGIDMELSAFNKTRSRNPSGSVGSRDYEEMSTASGISSTDGHHHAVFDESGDDLEIAARRRHISGDDSIQLKEISAVMALTSLARSRKNPHT